MSTFVTVKSADLKGAALDWAVALVERQHVVLAAPAYGNGWRVRYDLLHTQDKYSPSSCWKQGGPLIDKHVLQLKFYQHEHPDTAWRANAHDGWGEGATPLIAACRAIVASVLGEAAPVPEELT